MQRLLSWVFALSLILGLVPVSFADQIRFDWHASAVSTSWVDLKSTPSEKFPFGTWLFPDDKTCGGIVVVVARDENGDSAYWSFNLAIRHSFFSPTFFEVMTPSFLQELRPLSYAGGKSSDWRVRVSCDCGNYAPMLQGIAPISAGEVSWSSWYVATCTEKN